MLGYNTETNFKYPNHVDFREIYKICLPLVSIGKRHIAIKANKIKTPDAYIGASGCRSPVCAATIGANRPDRRLNREAIPLPVPRFGAGKISGVLSFLSRRKKAKEGNHLLRI